MKILTNLTDNKNSSINRSFSDLSQFINRQSRVDLVGINIVQSIEVKERTSIINKAKIRDVFLPFEKISNPLSNDISTLEDIKTKYEVVIEKFRSITIEEKPDAIILNGTYAIPWALMYATKDLNIPTFVHYHGLLTKEVAFRPDKDRNIFRQMERQFDNSYLKYIFPSNLAKKAVESEVFGHEIKSSLILPNPIPNLFFNSKLESKRKGIGFVGRWTPIKNLEFCINLANYLNSIKSKNKISLVINKMDSNKKLPGNAKKLGPFNKTQMKKFYQSIGAVISPSFFETYGCVAQEAVATGTPALVNKNMGVAEILDKYGLSDLIIDFASPAKVFQKIEDISGEVIDPKIRNRLKQDLTADALYPQMINFVSR